MPVKSLVVRVYVHATEDEAKVLEALRNVAPLDDIEEAEIEVEEYEGHYGNPIKVYTYKLRGQAARQVATGILSKLSSLDRSQVASSLEDRVDKTGTLHIRLSKQEALQGRITLYESDDVIKVEIGYTGGRRRAVEEYRELLKGDTQRS
ncbi:MAG: hypothetical protein F7B18_07170 [Desulfurococcales archaeon]|nr:hypothetical protein [Desulfurococcales archaeon]